MYWSCFENDGESRKLRKSHMLGRLLIACKKIENKSHNDDWMVQCGISNKQLVLGDSYFSSMMSATQMMKRWGHHFIWIVKTSHAKFQSKYISNKMKDAPTGSHILLTMYHERVYLCPLGLQVCQERKGVNVYFHQRCWYYKYGGNTLLSRNDRNQMPFTDSKEYQPQKIMI